MFEGFTPETIDFLWGIRMNNNREWFTAHKNQYVTQLYEPLKALSAELFEPYMKPGNIMKVSRIYRDARLHHPLPYKESLWCCIRKDDEWWAERPIVFFEINPDNVTYGFCVYRPKTSYMEAFRQGISARPTEFLELLRNAEATTGIPVTADLYKHPKETENPDLAPYFAWKQNISCMRVEPHSEATFGRGLAERVRTLFEQVVPLYDYFSQY